MNIVLTEGARAPIYERLIRAIKRSILKGELEPGDLLPSIRSLARDLDISVITTNRAYEELEKEDLIYSVQGKGFYVKKLDKNRLQEGQMQELEQKLQNCARDGVNLGISLEELQKTLELFYREAEAEMQPISRKHPEAAD